MVTKVQCPICGKKIEWSEKNTFRPFCCERCKQIDLGAWADEKYTVPVVEESEDDAEPGDEI